jgi:superfamily II DNA/RNA helicase
VPPLEQELIHRIGRAGRFGASGLALNLVSSDDKSSKTLSSFQSLSLSEAEVKIKEQLASPSNPETRLNKEKLLISNKA